MAVFKLLVKNGSGEIIAKEVHVKPEDKFDTYVTNQQSMYPELSYTKYKVEDVGYDTFETDHLIEASDPRLT